MSIATYSYHMDQQATETINAKQLSYSDPQNYLYHIMLLIDAFCLAIAIATIYSYL